MFDIRIYDATVFYEYEDVPHCIGEIVIGDFKETFYMPLDYWTIEQYQQQWREGLSRILENKTSCLITEIRDPKIFRHVTMWPMYQKQDIIVIRNIWFFGPIYKEQIGKKLVTLNSCYDFIPPAREKVIVEEDGEICEISMWYTDSATIKECLRNKSLVKDV